MTFRKVNPSNGRVAALGTLLRELSHDCGFDPGAAISYFFFLVAEEGSC